MIISIVNVNSTQEVLSKHLAEFKSTELSFRMGLDFISAGKYAKAEKKFKKCVKKMPKHAYAYYYLAEISYIKKDYKTALTQINKAKEFVPFMRELNNFSLKQNYNKLAKQKKEVNDFIDNIYRVFTSTEKERLKDRRAAIQEEIDKLNSQLNRQDSDSLDNSLKSNYCFLQGNILFQMKKYREACTQYIGAIQLNPRNWEAYNNLAGVFFLGKDYKTAFQYISLAETRGANINVNLQLKKLIYEALGKPVAGILEKEYPGGVMRFVVNVLEGRNTRNRLYENTYIVFEPGTKDAVIIDPGIRDKRIEEFIAARGLNVRKILNTHDHSDHTGANRFYADLYKAEILAHQADSQYFTEENKPDRFISGETGTIDVNNRGMEIKVIHTPGHTQGSVCFLVNHQLISGDTLFKGNIGRVFAKTDRERSKKRAGLIAVIKQKLLTLPGETRVFPGHGEPTTIKEEKETNPYFKENEVGALEK